jgi:hypothetical protein
METQVRAILCRHSSTVRQVRKQRARWLLAWGQQQQESQGPGGSRCGAGLTDYWAGGGGRAVFPHLRQRWKNGGAVLTGYPFSNYDSSVGRFSTSRARPPAAILITLTVGSHGCAHIFLFPGHFLVADNRW